MPFTHIPGVSIRYVPAGFASVVYDGTTIPADSVLFYDNGTENTPYTEGIHTGGNSEVSLTDSTKSLVWTGNEWTGYRIKNSTNDQTGAIVGNSTTVITATLTGAESWDTNDVYIIQHETLLQDTTKSWTPSEWVNLRVFNSEDGSSGVIASNTTNTITVNSLSGGDQNAFKVGDVYQIESNIDINDLIEYESTTNLGGTVSMTTQGVPSVSGISGTHTFNFRLVDVSDGNSVSAEVLFTVTV